MPTTASAFLNALLQAGVTHAFVNWGNDHPGILEELERQRVEQGSTAIEIVTCPNEMVALSAAQGFTQVTGTPSAVIVHVDVGTQGLAGAIHNVDRGRIPVLIFAGASPFSGQGELKGSKNEWPMWTQDIPDQSAIVRQYMRYTAQILSGKNVAKVVMRALQIATSSPQGPAYLYARREIFEEDLDADVAFAKVDVGKWPAIAPAALSPDSVEIIVDALRSARFPLIITGYMGRNPNAVQPLLDLSELLGVALYMSAPSAVSVPHSFPLYLGQSFGGKNALLDEADVVLVIDTDVPWIDACDNAPQPDARVFMIDADPLKINTGWSHIDAERICKADSQVALEQLVEAVKGLRKGALDDNFIAKRREELTTRHNDFIGRLDVLETSLQDGDEPDAALVLATLRETVAEATPSRGQRTLWLNESISNYPKSFDHIRPDRPGSMLFSGGSSLGWILGAAVGATLGSRAAQKDHDLMVAIVGDGTYLFGIPSSAYWMARRYDTPYLTVILNNGGWASPKNSLMGIYPDGHGSKATGQRLSIALGPEMPDHAQIAAAAGGAWGKRVTDMRELKQTILEGIRVVIEEKRCAVLDCILQSI